MRRESIENVTRKVPTVGEIRWNTKVLRTRVRLTLRNLWYAPRVYENWLYMIASNHVRGSGVLRLRNGCKFQLRPRTTDRAMINEMFIERPYTPDGIFAIRNNDRILDIGANIGAFTVFAARQARQGCVHSVEPVAANFQILENNVRLNGLKNVRLLRAAVGSGTGKLRIAAAGAASSVVWVDKESTEEVDQIKLQSLIEDMGSIDLLKMDCEGAEFDILMNASPEVLKRIPRIAMEYHNVSADQTAQTLKSFLEAHGFKVTVVGEDWTGLLFAWRQN